MHVQTVYAHTNSLVRSSFVLVYFDNFYLLQTYIIYHFRIHTPDFVGFTDGEKNVTFDVDQNVSQKYDCQFLAVNSMHILLSTVKKCRIFSLVTNTIFSFSQ